jgi:ATP-dependent helicase/nuclease subunit A
MEILDGLVVATERDGLVDTPECVLTLSALRYLVDGYDTIAIAEFVRLTSPDPAATEWLTDWLKRGYQDFAKTVPRLVSLADARKQLEHLSPTEVLELAITVGGVCEEIKKWGKVRQRFLNLDALRGLGKSYEELCETRRSAATPAGFITFVDRESKRPFQPPNPADEAVQVLTYHKAKGLEWPMVIMSDLDRPIPATPFGITVESAEATLDPLDPLSGRQIRYWPWPYGLQRTDIPLQSKAARSSEMSVAAKRNIAENLRLLYVGMTRARDYLILSCRPSLEELAG